MSAVVHFGLFLPNRKFKTADGEFILEKPSDGSIPPESDAYLEAPEREGQYAVLRAVQDGRSLREAVVQEVLPPIANAVMGRLLDADNGLRPRVLELAREVQDELLGTEPPVLEEEEPLRVVVTGPRPICVVEIGHCRTAPGASGQLGGREISEFEFNTDLANRIAALVQGAEVITLSRDDGPGGLSGLPAKINRHKPRFVISLHANAAGAGATGTEVLYYHTSEKGKKLAAILQEQLLNALKLRDRGLKPRTVNDRGGGQLRNTEAPIVIGEPFFISNPNDLKTATDRKDALAAAYAAAIDAYAASLSETPPVQVRPVPPAPQPPVPQPVSSAGREFVTAGLTKEQFLERNDAALMGLIGDVNAILEAKYGRDFRPLTRHDVWVTIYCEAGLKSGLVDANFRHSEGERGILPLPDNIKHWNGPDAPNWDEPMPVGQNLKHFFLYLGHLKNKSVATRGGQSLYRDLFRTTDIMGNPVREAKVLGAVVHGYFYSGTYRDRTVPMKRLIDGFQRDLPLTQIMDGTTYRHAGTSVLRGRERNIDEALRLV